MKTLLLTLLLGLACADLSPEELSEISGEWKTFYMISTNVEIISLNGGFTPFVRKMEFDTEGGTILFKYFMMVNGECVKYRDMGVELPDNHYLTSYSGVNDFSFLYASENSLVEYLFNKDENGTINRIMIMFGKGNEANEEDFEKFLELTREKDIPLHNIVNFINFDTCPTS